MEIDYHLFKHYPDERYIANLPWVTAQERRRAGLPSSSDTVANSECVHRSSYKLKSIDPLGRSSAESEAWHKVLAHSATQARVRAVQMHLNCVTALSALPLALSCCEKRPVFGAFAALRNLHTDELERDWVYDTGAGGCFIGYEYLTTEEKSRTYQVAPQKYATAAGITCTTTAVMCNIPFLGKRQCHVLDDSPPAISVRSDVMDYGVKFSYSRENGPSVSLSDGTIVYLQDLTSTPVLNGYCKSEKPKSKRTETLAMTSTADIKCLPCGQAPWPWTQADIKPTNALPVAAISTGNDGNPWSESPSAPKPKPITTERLSARQQRQLCPERQRDGTTPNLVLPEDVAIGNGHGASARRVSAKSDDGNVRVMSSYVDMISRPFFVEVFSGTGRMASGVREHGLDAFEFDLNKQGGNRNLLHNKVLHELRALIAHPLCRGVWFGYPCGTFSSARRHDGGPKPLRGTNSKEIWGLPHIKGKERARVDSANKLLLRMHELMKHCENSAVPFYLENPKSSKLWMHPIIRKWIQNKASHKVEFDYCQFGTTWKKSTTILAVGNR